MAVRLTHKKTPVSSESSGPQVATRRPPAPSTSVCPRGLVVSRRKPGATPKRSALFKSTLTENTQQMKPDAKSFGCCI